jgi:transcriptional regulator with XRE-family HTH domain
MLSFKDIIRRARKSKKFKQQELSELVDCGRNHICKIECGEVQPSAQMLEKIFRALDIVPIIIDKDKNSILKDIAENLHNLSKDDLEIISEIIKIKSRKHKL